MGFHEETELNSCWNICVLKKKKGKLCEHTDDDYYTEYTQNFSFFFASPFHFYLGSLKQIHVLP